MVSPYQAIPVLHPQGPVALAELHVIGITLLLSSIIVVPLFIMLAVFAWKYRIGNTKSAREHHPRWDHMNPLFEFAWWLVPAIIIVMLSVVAWVSSHQLDPYVPLVGTEAPITIQVVALDWKWLFIYPEQGIATVNMVEFPAGAPVHFEITSDAPMNSFWIPALAGQIMAMPGMQTQLNVLASNPGEFRGVSANLSGAGFAGMNFEAKAVSEDDFSAWIASVKASSPTLTRDSYQTLAVTSSNNPITYYSMVDSSLYTSIINSYMTPQDASTSTDGMNMNDMPMGTMTP